jgi:hypothetical protein
MFSIKCFPLSPTSYPKISTRRVPMQPWCHSLWLLLSVCTYPVYVTLLYCQILFMHWPLHITCLVCVQEHSLRLITMTHSNIVFSRSHDSSSCYPCVPHTYNYPYAGLLSIPTANCPESSYPLIIAMWINSCYFINSIFVILYIIFALVLSSKTLKLSMELF